MPDIPNGWESWDFYEDGSYMHIEDGGKHYYWEEWFTWLMTNVFMPLNIKVNGVMTWDGEESTDQGTIYVEDNKFDFCASEIVESPPYWKQEKISE